MNLNLYVEYEENAPSSEGRFTYEIISDDDALGATLGPDGRELGIPAGKNIRNGYRLTVRAHEETPYIRPLALSRSACKMENIGV